ncbi:unnamed protein product [Lampetra planeri]
MSTPLNESSMLARQPSSAVRGANAHGPWRGLRGPAPRGGGGAMSAADAEISGSSSSWGGGCGGAAMQGNGLRVGVLTGKPGPARSDLSTLSRSLSASLPACMARAARRRKEEVGDEEEDDEGGGAPSGPGAARLLFSLRRGPRISMRGGSSRCLCYFINASYVAAAASWTLAAATALPSSSSSSTSTRRRLPRGFLRRLPWSSRPPSLVW